MKHHEPFPLAVGPNKRTQPKTSATLPANIVSHETRTARGARVSVSVRFTVLCILDLRFLDLVQTHEVLRLPQRGSGLVLIRAFRESHTLFELVSDLRSINAHVDRQPFYT
jgi:hypothetical protein